MAFYDLEKKERAALVATITAHLEAAFRNGEKLYPILYFSDQDTYIRKWSYIATGRIYQAEEGMRERIRQQLWQLMDNPDEKVRQAAVNAAGEIGKTDFAVVQAFFDKGLFDSHHIVRNAVIGSVKKMGEVNPVPVLSWAGAYLHHPDQEIRREICHGIELRGRLYPEDILPMLRELEWDKAARVRNTLVHVLGQIAYKKGCLEKVVQDLKKWDNKTLVQEAYAEILSVHHRYRNFAVYTQAYAREYIAAQAL
jgi:hypothetical protein